MKTNLFKLAIILLLITANSFISRAADIGNINVHWTTNSNCSPLASTDQWEISLAIVHYPSLNFFWGSGPYIYTNVNSGAHEFVVDESCYDSQAQYLVIASVKLRRNGQIIGQGEYKAVMTCYDLYQLNDIYVTCSCG